MKNVLALLCCVFICSAVFAQGKMEEVIYLKNDSSTRGMIMEYIPNVSISIMSQKKLYTYKLSDVARITRESSKQDSVRRISSKYEGIIELGLTDFPYKLSNTAMASINFVNGKRFNPYVFLGFGIGVDISQHVFNIPATIDLRTYFTKTRVVPFFALAFGYNLQIGNYYSSTFTQGIVFNPSVGVRFNLKHKKAISLGLGYKMIDSFVKDYGRITVTPQHGLSFKLGYHF